MKRAAFIAALLLAGFALVLRLTPAEQSAPDVSRGKQEFTWVRLAEHEALAAEILGATGHHGSVRVYLDTVNSDICAHAFVEDRAVVLTEKCGAPPHKDGRTDWRVVGVLAHEIGHIVKRHADASPEAMRKQQREADEFAGLAMRLLGATLEEARTFRIPEPEPFAEPPEADEDYLAAIERGWKRAARKTPTS